MSGYTVLCGGCDLRWAYLYSYVQDRFDLLGIRSHDVGIEHTGVVYLIGWYLTLSTTERGIDSDNTRAREKDMTTSHRIDEQAGGQQGDMAHDMLVNNHVARVVEEGGEERDNNNNSGTTSLLLDDAQKQMFMLAVFTFGTSNVKKISQVMGVSHERAGEERVAEFLSHISGVDELPYGHDERLRGMTWDMLLSKRTRQLSIRFLMNASRLKRVQKMADKILTKEYAQAVSSILVLFRDGYVDAENFVESLVIMLGRQGTVKALDLPEFLVNMKDVKAEHEGMMSPTSKKRGLSALFVEASSRPEKQVKQQEDPAVEAGMVAQERGHEPQAKACYNCGTTSTPLWRKDKTLNIIMCNACGIYYKNHGRHRPVALSQTSPGKSAKKETLPGGSITARMLGSSGAHQAAHAALRALVAQDVPSQEPAYRASRRSSRPRKPRSLEGTDMDSDFSGVVSSEESTEKMRGELIDRLITTVPTGFDVDGAIKGLWSLKQAAMKDEVTGENWGTVRLYADVGEGDKITEAGGVYIPRRESYSYHSGPNTSKNATQTCENCGTQQTPLWRKDKETGVILCNACGIYRKTHGVDRPVTAPKPVTVPHHDPSMLAAFYKGPRSERSAPSTERIEALRQIGHSAFDTRPIMRSPKVPRRPEGGSRTDDSYPRAGHDVTAGGAYGFPGSQSQSFSTPFLSSSGFKGQYSWIPPVSSGQNFPYRAPAHKHTHS